MASLPLRAQDGRLWVTSGQEVLTDPKQGLCRNYWHQHHLNHHCHNHNRDNDDDDDDDDSDHAGTGIAQLVVCW